MDNVRPAPPSTRVSRYHYKLCPFATSTRTGQCPSPLCPCLASHLMSGLHCLSTLYSDVESPRGIVTSNSLCTTRHCLHSLSEISPSRWALLNHCPIRHSGILDLHPPPRYPEPPLPPTLHINCYLACDNHLRPLFSPSLPACPPPAAHTS